MLSHLRTLGLCAGLLALTARSAAEAAPARGGRPNALAVRLRGGGRGMKAMRWNRTHFARIPLSVTIPGRPSLVVERVRMQCPFKAVERNLPRLRTWRALLRVRWHYRQAPPWTRFRSGRWCHSFLERQALPGPRER